MDAVISILYSAKVEQENDYYYTLSDCYLYTIPLLNIDLNTLAKIRETTTKRKGRETWLIMVEFIFYTVSSPAACVELVSYENHTVTVNNHQVCGRSERNH